jgi:hypothetical protein
LTARYAAYQLLARTERSTAAAENWPHDMELRAAVDPGSTDTAGPAGTASWMLLCLVVDRQSGRFYFIVIFDRNMTLPSRF